MSDEETDPDRLRAAAENARRHPPTVEELTAVLMVLTREQGGTVVCSVEEVEAQAVSGQALHVTEEDGEVRFHLVDDPVSVTVEAILGGPREWLETATGRAVRVTGGRGKGVIFVREGPVGSWSEPVIFRAGCFLRDHVLASGVPLLG